MPEKCKLYNLESFNASLKHGSIKELMGRKIKVIKLYDKKYVYFEWDDKLEGKEVFCATSIEDLKSQVNYGNAQTGALHHSNNPEGHPFVPTWSDGSGSRAYPFAYYDPNYEVKKAYNEGKKLQWKYRNEEDWSDWDIDSCPTFFDDTTGYELRVKPEECEIDKDEEKDRLLTNKEIAKWVSEGKGQIKFEGTQIVQTFYKYVEGFGNVNNNEILVCKWGDDLWHEPTYDYCYGEE